SLHYTLDPDGFPIVARRIVEEMTDRRDARTSGEQRQRRDQRYGRRHAAKNTGGSIHDGMLRLKDLVCVQRSRRAANVTDGPAILQASRSAARRSTKRSEGECLGPSSAARGPTSYARWWSRWRSSAIYRPPVHPRRATRPVARSESLPPTRLHRFVPASGTSRRATAIDPRPTDSTRYPGRRPASLPHHDRMPRKTPTHARRPRRFRRIGRTIH